MSDRRLRELERAVAQGDLSAEARLNAEWRRHGLCVCCGATAIEVKRPKLSLVVRAVQWLARVKEPPAADPICERCNSIIRSAEVKTAADAMASLVRESLNRDIASIRDGLNRDAAALRGDVENLRLSARALREIIRNI